MKGADAGVTSDAGAAEDALAVSACLSQVCSDEAKEPVPGFFDYCCASGGADRYDEFCVLVVWDECRAVAALCADRCAPLELLTGTVTLPPPTAACLEGYPPFVASVCSVDPFCCETSWDSLCAEEALVARSLQKK